MTDKRTNTRPEKKSETLEVRLPHSKKEAFKAACEDEGITASHAVRTFIDAYLKRSHRVKLEHITKDITMKLIHNPLKAAGMALTSLAAFALMAAPSSADEKLFKALDSNGDGVLTESDSAPLEKVIFILDNDDSDSITLDEFRTMARYTRLFQPNADTGQLSAQSNKVTVNKDGKEVIFSGEPEVTHTPTEDNPHSDLRAEIATKTILSLITMDLTSPGEVRFKSENITLDALRQIDHLDHIIVEIEGDLLDEWGRKAAEVETP